SLRLGFACAHQELVHAMSQYGMIESGGGASPFVSGIVDRILEQGLLKKFLDEKLCVEYSKRMQVLHDELMKTFSNENITCRQPSGGYFLWVKFNDTTVDCDQLLVIAQKHGVKFQPGRLFAHSTKAKAELVNYLRKEDETALRIFSDPHRKILQRGGTEGLIIAVLKSLGPLNYLYIWHDNSGQRDKTS
ncbi:unnamed protein product, partial [Adineta steineri]